MDDYPKLFTSCLKILGRRPRSEKEISDFLSKKTKNTALINQIIGKLKEIKLINDAEFAHWLIESRSRSRPRGPRLLDLELKSKGIDPETMSDHRMTTNDEIALAKKALEKKSNLWLKLSEREFNQKAWRFLMTRGFSTSVIAEVVKKMYNEPQC